MGKIVRKSSQVTLVLVTTLLSISLALLIVFIGYKVMDDQIRKTEIIMTIIAPLVISSTVTWYLYGLIKRLESLEQELRQRITKEKEAVYFATIRGAQHITNNLLNGLILVDMEIEKHPTFNKETAMLFHEMLYEAKQLIDKLSSVDLITPESIKKSVEPT
ncbi:MAG: hypothetical protein Q3M30_16205 [Candidatus Electrothrix sp. Rat3]|nr:hypothetical protein [Candidatus Electrothrix rattekaaiensis]